MPWECNPFPDEWLRAHSLPKLEANQDFKGLTVNRHKNIDNHNVFNGPKRPQRNSFDNKIRSPSQENKEQKEARFLVGNEPVVIIPKTKKIAIIDKKTTGTLQTEIEVRPLKNRNGNSRISPQIDRTYSFHHHQLTRVVESDSIGNFCS